MTMEINTDTSYNKQDCIDSFMNRKDLDETEQDLRNRIIAKNNDLSRRGHQLEKMRQALENAEREFSAVKGEVNGLINFAFSREISYREEQVAKSSNGVDKTSNGEAQHGA